MLLFASVVVIAAGLRLADALVVPLLAAACLAAATAPFVHFLNRRGLPTGLSVSLTVAVVMGAVWGLAYVVALAAQDFRHSLPGVERTVAAAQRGAVEWLEGWGLSPAARVVLELEPGAWGRSLMAAAVLEVPRLLSILGVVLFVVIFILLEAATFRGKLHCALGWRAERFEEVQETVGEVQRYLLVKSALSALTGLLCGLWCLVMGLDGAALWGLLAFVLNFVPVFGSIVATALPVGVAFASSGPAVGFAVLSGFLVVNNAIGNLLEPRLLGRAVGLSPLVVVLSIVAWGWLLGPVGALLSVPLTMIARIVLAHSEDLRWVAVLLGPGEGWRSQLDAEQRLSSSWSRSDAVTRPEAEPGPAE